MRLSIKPKAQEVFDKALAAPESEPDSPNTVKGNGYEVWEDGSTGILCKVSTLSGSLMGFASVAPGHPWFNRNDCPLPGVSSFGTIHHPKVCQGRWWFYFSLRGNDKEAAKQKCRILAAQLEIEGSELAQQISTATLNKDTKSIGYLDEGVDDKVRRTTKMWANCNTLTTFPLLDQGAYKEIPW